MVKWIQTFLTNKTLNRIRTRGFFFRDETQMIDLGNICQYNPDLILLGDILVLVVGVWTDAAGLSLNDRDLHVLDLYTNQQEVNLPNDHILCTIVKLINYLYICG